MTITMSGKWGRPAGCSTAYLTGLALDRPMGSPDCSMGGVRPSQKLGQTLSQTVSAKRSRNGQPQAAGTGPEHRPRLPPAGHQLRHKPQT